MMPSYHLLSQLSQEKLEQYQQEASEQSYVPARSVRQRLAYRTRLLADWLEPAVSKQEYPHRSLG